MQEKQKEWRLNWELIWDSVVNIPEVSSLDYCSYQFSLLSYSMKKKKKSILNIVNPYCCLLWIPPLERQYAAIIKIEDNIRDRNADQCMVQYHHPQAHNGTKIFSVCAKCVICCISNHVIVFFFSTISETTPAQASFAYTLLPEWNCIHQNHTSISNWKQMVL